MVRVSVYMGGARGSGKSCTSQFLYLTQHIDDAYEEGTSMLKTAHNKNIIPHTWKLAYIVPIPQPNKDTDKSTSYRPISLLHIFQIKERGKTGRGALSNPI